MSFVVKVGSGRHVVQPEEYSYPHPLRIPVLSRRSHRYEKVIHTSSIDVFTDTEILATPASTSCSVAHQLQVQATQRSVTGEAAHKRAKLPTCQWATRLRSG